VLEIEQSPEYRTDQVNNAYEVYLHRAADPSGLQTGLSVLAYSGLELEQEFIAASPEFFQLQGSGTYNGWLTAIYQDALGRAVDQGGRAAFDYELSNGLITLRQAAHIILTSQEYDQDLVNRYYAQFLRRSADPGGAVFWLNELLSGVPLEQVIAGFVGSTEYFNLAQT
jgi:hypothetical protein